MLSEKPWKREGILRLLMSLLISIAFVVMLSTILQPSSGAKPDDNSPVLLVVNSLVLDGSFLVSVFVFLRCEHLTWADAFGFKTPGLGLALLFGVIVALCFLPIGMALNALCLKLFQLFHLPSPDQEAVESLKKAAPGFNRFYLVFFALVLAPVSEESFFRGVLYPTIKQFGFPRAALWGTSLFFGAIHLNAAAFVPLTVLALALALLYEKTNNLLACITAHSVFNAANVALLLFYPDAGS